MPCVLRSDPERPIPSVVRDTLVEKHGWEEYDESLPPEQQPPVTLYWKTNRFYPSEIAAMKYPRQRVNHYPKSSEITKKDLLYRHLRRMKTVHGPMYDYVPITHALPTEYVKFCQFYAEQREKAEEEKRPEPIYICKPSELSRGRKIFCFTDIGDLTYDCSSVVQTYVSNPLLIHGHKTDFRIYVLVASFRPLRAYIFEDGLARMSAEVYDTSNVKNIFAHLTNYSINKNSEHWDEEKDGIGTGFKWDLPRTRAHFASLGVDFSVLFERIENLVCLTLLAIANNVQLVPQCFELYGFDVLFDQDFKPWLMEVNFSPALAVESDVDARVKEPLIWDIVRTLGIAEPNPDDAVAAPNTEATPVPEKKVEPVAKSVSATSASTGLPPRRRSVTEEGAASPTVTKSKSAALLPPQARKASTGTPTPGSAPAPKPSTSRGQSSTKASARASNPSAEAPPPVKASAGSVPTSLTKRSNSAVTKPVAKSSSSSSSTPPGGPSQPGFKFIDSPQGQFKRCFPFNDAVEKLNTESLTSPTPEKQIHAIISEIKKRELKAQAAIKSWTVKPDTIVGIN